MPYFPYSRQSKKKSHRGAITARMLANLLDVAGVSHVITIDLHASQMQGFFHCPVDNLVAEPIIAHWIKVNIPEWRSAVVVSKNPGGTKRTTSLADALKLDFGIVMTDRCRPNSGRNSMNNSTIFEGQVTPGHAKREASTSGDSVSTTITGTDQKDMAIRPNTAANDAVPLDGSDVSRAQTARSAIYDPYESEDDQEEELQASDTVSRQGSSTLH